MPLERYKFGLYGIFFLTITACDQSSAATGANTAASCGSAVGIVARTHIPKAIKALSDLGKLEDQTNIPVTIALGLNNEAELDQSLRELYRPGSPTYHQFMNPQDFRARYAPTARQLERAQAFLTAQGLTLLETNSNRLFIKAQGSVQALNAAFQTELHRYRDAQGKSYFSPAYEPQLPQGLSIQGVHGLQNFSRWRRHSARLPSVSDPRAASGPAGGLSPTDIRAAYRIPTTVNGAGQTLAVFELDGYAPSDISAYEQNFGLPAVPLQNVSVDQATGTPGSGEGEVTLDIELMLAIAPGASKILVYEGPNDEQGMLDTYSKIANDNLARQISTSWGSAEDGTDSSFVQSENTVFKQMAAQGQSMFAAAGDAGAYDDGSALSVDDPGSQPYIVSVGGSTLYTNADGSYDHETTWNDGSASAGAGGGGFSSTWPQPTWQNGLSTSQNQASATMRNVPDVSLEANYSTGYSIYTSGQWGLWGGTSCAAPIWAAFTALVNQQRQADGLSPVGFLNPAIYQIGQSARYSDDFNDIKDGSTNLVYPAVTGYDDATGWGSFNGEGLFQDLTKDSLPD